MSGDFFQVSLHMLEGYKIKIWKGISLEKLCTSSAVTTHWIHAMVQSSLESSVPLRTSSGDLESEGCTVHSYNTHRRFIRAHATLIKEAGSVHLLHNLLCESAQILYLRREPMWTPGYSTRYKQHSLAFMQRSLQVCHLVRRSECFRSCTDSRRVVHQTFLRTRHNRSFSVPSVLSHQYARVHTLANLVLELHLRWHLFFLCLSTVLYSAVCYNGQNL